MAAARIDPSTPARIWLTLYVVLVILGGSLVFSQADPAAQGPVVAELRIRGNNKVPVEKIIPNLRTRAGRPYDSHLIEEDVRRLYQTRKFVKVNALTEETAAGKVVIFEVLERPMLEYVKFVGNEKVKKKTLAKEIMLKAGDGMDPYAVEEGRRKLIDYYHTKGFSKVYIEVAEGSQANDRGVIYVINEGPKQRVLWTQFEGNSFANDGRLRTQIKSKPGFLWVFHGEVDRKQIEEDVNRLTAYYRSMGFFSARIGRPLLDYNENQDWLTLTYVIEEGPRYRVRDVRILGNRRFTIEELTEDQKLKSGQYFNQGERDADVAAMSDVYGGEGYVFTDVKPELRFLEEPGQVDLVYNIRESERYRVGKINVQIKGDYPHTKINTVLNRLSVRPGDIVDTRELRASERRLKASGLFKVDQSMGIAPKIVFSKSDLEKEAEQVASPPRRPEGFRGQSPDPDRFADLTIEGEFLDEPGQPAPETPAADAPAAAAPRPEFGPPLPPPGSENNAEPLPADAVLRGQSPDGQAQLHWGVPVYRPQAPPDLIRGQGSYEANSGVSVPSLQTPVPSTEPGPVVPSPLEVRPAPRPATTPLPGPVYGGAARPETTVPPGSMLNGAPVLQDPTASWNVGPNAPLYLPLTPDLQETQTGRFMFSVGVNSDLGVVGSIVVDEQNFDWTRCPTSWEDIRNGTAWRGAGQRFRFEAMPGSSVSRYAVSVTEPYLLDTNISLGVSAHYYERRYFEWDENRAGGRVAFGYQFVPDLSGSIAYRGENVKVFNPVTPPGVLPELDEVVGASTLHGFRAGLTLDKRDNTFLATEGFLAEVGFEQVIGTFQYPRFDAELRKYFTLYQHPDGSGRHVLSLGTRVGITGDDTPVYDRFFAGGFSTIRGFDFRGASYRDKGVTVGGDFMLLASAEYMFPITADDMLRGVVFCDTGTVEPTIGDWSDKYRVAPGVGMRITVPAMGPAPIALDFAFPVSKEEGDHRQVFSFFVGFLR